MRSSSVGSGGLSPLAMGELGVTAQAAHKAVKRGLQDRAKEIAEAAELRALESARLDAAAQALWPKVMAGEERAQEVWLRNRFRYAALNGLDVRPEQIEGPTIVHINTEPPPSVVELMEQHDVGELKAGSG